MKKLSETKYWALRYSKNEHELKVFWNAANALKISDQDLHRHFNSLASYISALDVDSICVYRNRGLYLMPVKIKIKAFAAKNKIITPHYQREGLTKKDLILLREFPFLLHNDQFHNDIRQSKLEAKEHTELIWFFLN